MLRSFDAPYPVYGRPVGPFAMNQYVVAHDGQAVIIDAGASPTPFRDAVAPHGATIGAVWQTHAHVDHVAGLADTKRLLDVPVHLHPLDRPVLDSAVAAGLMFGLSLDPPPPPDHELSDGQVLSVGGLRFEVLHTPGHAPGHVCFYDGDNGVMFCGDLVFRGSIGRLDLPGCEPDRMGPSLARILALPDDVLLLPGHMEPTTIGHERATNPFFREFGLT